MFMYSGYFSRMFVVRTKVILLAVGLFISVGCGGTTPVADTTGPTGDDPVVVNDDQLSSKGSLSGTIAETRTTRDSGDVEGAE